MYYTGLLWELDEWIFVNCIEQCRAKEVVQVFDKQIKVGFVNLSILQTSGTPQGVCLGTRNDSAYAVTQCFWKYILLVQNYQAFLLKTPKESPLSQRLPGDWSGPREHHPLVSDRSIRFKKYLSKVLQVFAKVDIERVSMQAEKWADYNREELFHVPQWNVSIRAESRNDLIRGGPV